MIQIQLRKSRAEDIQNSLNNLMKLNYVSYLIPFYLNTINDMKLGCPSWQKQKSLCGH